MTVTLPLMQTATLALHCWKKVSMTASMRRSPQARPTRREAVKLEELAE